MDFFDVVNKRYSVRSYLPDPVENEKLQKVLEVGRLAPTAHNNQPFQIIVIRTEGKQEELKQIYRREWFSQPPLVLCLSVVKDQGWVRGYDQRSYYQVDAGIVMDHIILAATALGLGTCWIGAFNISAAREFLGLPEGVEPIVFSPLGYPAELPKPRERKPLSELVRYDHW
jgi:nitroreductase